MNLFKPSTISRRKFGRLMTSGLFSAGLSYSGMISTAVAALDTMKPLDRASPDTLLADPHGIAASLPQRVDRPMLVNFWASWCPPCVHELPSLQQLDTALRDHDMAVMLVGLDRKGADFGQAFLDEKGIEIPRSVFDKTGAIARALEIRVMPTSFFIRPEGQIIGKIEGPSIGLIPQ